METPHWVLEPLVAAGLTSQEICELLFRLAFEGVVPAPDVDNRVRAVIGGRPADVQAAWTETISRMIAADSLG